MKKILFLVPLLALFLTSCEDVIQIDLNRTKTRLSVDAWLTNKSGIQTIKLRATAAYLDTIPAPAITGATVSVKDNEGKIYQFIDEKNNGNYNWNPTGNETFGKIGNTYTLEIKLNGQTYQAASKMNPVPPIDSISTEFRKDQIGTDDGYWAVLNASDLPGLGNCYWVKTYKNGKYLSLPAEINIAYDAAFKNSGVDNQPFIVPIAETINPITTNRRPPYNLDDKIRVELWSITTESYDFISQVQNEMLNGGLFATIPANVSTNIISPTDGQSPKSVGFFCISAVSLAETTVR